MGGSTVAEIVKDETNLAGAPILTVYAKVHKTYAIYRTEEGFVIQFADDERLGRRQRRALAPLNSIKGEINGIIDGWRSSTSPDKEAKAKLFDRRVADALHRRLPGPCRLREDHPRDDQARLDRRAGVAGPASNICWWRRSRPSC